MGATICKSYTQEFIQYGTEHFIVVIGRLENLWSILFEFDIYVVLEVGRILNKEVVSLLNCHLPELQVITR